jgi:hypothetical protein
MSTPEDLAQTVKDVEALDRRIIATQADVRDLQALKKARTPASARSRAGTRSPRPSGRTPSTPT